jgi:alkyl sulfatase BDS1-like metallo-beta-lactamase superfamily hydrolase
MRSNSFARVSILGILAAGLLQGAGAQTQDARNDATEATKRANSALLRQLPFSDNSDFGAANKGFLAALPSD